ncbi:hypothetical protein CM9_01315 [Mycoplasmoides genitalium M2321]|nr:hypothetical protein CM9_01315 [Mycoplasmoides genitalium M2321]
MPNSLLSKKTSMYKPKNINSVLTFYKDQIQLVVSDDQNQFNILFYQTIDNDGFYSKQQLKNKLRLKLALNQLVDQANYFLGFKLEKVVVVLAELIDDLKIHNFKSEIFFTGYDFDHKAMIKKEKQRFCEQNNQLTVMDTMVLNYHDVINNKITKSFAFNKSYVANLVAYSSKSNLIGELKFFLKRNVNLKVKKIISHHLALANSLSKKQNNMFVYLGQKTTELMLFMDNALVDVITNQFGKNHFIDIPANQENKPLLEFLVDNTTKIGDCYSLGMTYTDGDSYKEIKALTIGDLMQTVSDKIKTLIDFINSGSLTFFNKFKTLPKLLYFYTRSKQITNLFQANVALINPQFKTVDIYKNKIQFISENYLLSCEAISLQITNRIKNQISFDFTNADNIQKPKPKKHFMILSKHLTKFVQRLVK